MSGATVTWSKDGSTDLPDGVTAHNDGALHIAGNSPNVAGQYTIDVTNPEGRTSKTIYVKWNEAG